LTATFLVFVAGSVFAGKLPIAVVWVYLAASLVAFIAYALDKSAARNDQWRTKESTLHLFALAGGWPGRWPQDCFATSPGSSRFNSCSGSPSSQLLRPCLVLLKLGSRALRSMLGTA
jgi:hypothetical protein